MMNFPSRWRTLKLACAMSLASALAACGGGTSAETSQNSASNVQASLRAVSGGTQAANVQILPLEVLGTGAPSKPVIAEAQLSVDASKLGSVTQLWFQCHRCGFYSAPEFEKTSAMPTKIKASVRVLGGAATSSNTPWIDITDANVTLADDERLHGGVKGGFYTTRITLPLDAAARARLVALPSSTASSSASTAPTVNRTASGC